MCNWGWKQLAKKARRCNIKIYIAHEYGRRWGKTDFECQQNVDESLEMTRELIKMGHNPFNPLLWHYIHKGWKDTPNEDKYFELVSGWIKSCGALLVGKMPPWEHSGVQRELDMAQAMDMPVYWSIDDIPSA